MTERIPPCLDPKSQTPCHRAYLDAGGELPCDLYKAKACRPGQRDATNLSAHQDCPVAFSPVELVSDEEEAIHQNYLEKIILLMD